MLHRSQKRGGKNELPSRWVWYHLVKWSFCLSDYEWWRISILVKVVYYGSGGVSHTKDGSEEVFQKHWYLTIKVYFCVCVCVCVFVWLQYPLVMVCFYKTTNKYTNKIDGDMDILGLSAWRAKHFTSPVMHSFMNAALPGLARPTFNSPNILRHLVSRERLFPSPSRPLPPPTPPPLEVPVKTL